MDLKVATVVLLAVVAVALAWLAIEANRLRGSLEPVLESSIATALTSF